MGPGDADLAQELLQPEQPQSTVLDDKLTDVVKEAWKKCCSSLTDEERKKFEENACKGLPEYLKRLEAACKTHQDKSLGFKTLDWFKPMFKAVELFMPAANTAIQAYPNPGSLVLGGITAVLTLTNRIDRYQKLTLQMLSKMGRKAQVLLEYETDLYKDDFHVQKALVDIYGDIILFCHKAFRFLTENGELKARVKGFRLITFRDFESHFEKDLENFESHMDNLEARASSCNTRRLKEVRDNLETQRKQFEQVLEESRNHSTHFQHQNDIVVNLWNREEEYRNRNEQRKQEKDKARLLDWLSPLSFETLYYERCEEHLDGTGSWLIESKAYQNWKLSDGSDMLWIKGKPGCGKSVLAAVTIFDLSLGLAQGNALAYAFCRRENESSQDPSNIFYALAKQICKQETGINGGLEIEFQKSHRGDKPSPTTVRTVVNSALSHLTKTYIVIDALDECAKGQQLANELLNLVRNKSNSGVKLIVFSRPDYDLEECFKPCEEIRPDHGENQRDLEAYIESLFPDSSQSSLNQKIRDECIAKAEGMFLWVKLLHQALRKPGTSKQKQKRMKGILPGLGSLYDRMLDNIWDKNRDEDEDVRSTALLALIWVTHAKRPLSQFEMLEAVADYDEVGTHEALQESKLTNAGDLLATCDNLVAVDKDENFRMCHESLRDYLDKTTPNMIQPLVEYQQYKQNAHERLAEICLNYLLLKDFECGPAKSLSKLKALLKKCPFLQYAAEFWGSHASQNLTPPLHNLILKLVQCKQRRELAMQVFFFDPRDDTGFRTFAGSSNPLHILSIFGLREIAETLPDVVELAQECDGTGKTPLVYALVITRHHEMSLWLIQQVRTEQGSLLDHDAMVTATHIAAYLGWTDVLEKLISGDEGLVNSKMEPDSPSPLFGACYAGHKETAAVLIGKDANVNLVGGEGQTPLLVSIKGRHTELVDQLLEAGADANCSDEDGATALHWAAEIGDDKMTTALLNKDANPLATVPTMDDNTPFHIAAGFNFVEVIKALHHKHSRLDMKSNQGATPLHMAAWFDAPNAAETLLELGVPKDDIDDENQTAVFIAAQEGYLDTVKVLVEAKCDVSIPDSKGQTAIYAAARCGNLSVLRFIMSHQPIDDWKSLVNRRSKNNETSLHAAIDSGNAEIVAFLLGIGADASLNGILKSSPLHYAAHYGHKAMSRLLLERTKDANPRNEGDDTPLQFAARSGKLDFILQLFEDCAHLGLPLDVDAQNENKNTALHIALDKGYEEIVKYLVDKTSVSVPNSSGNYPLHLAAWCGFDSVVQMLLPRGGLTHRGYVGRTPLFCASLRGHLNSLKILADAKSEALNIRDDNQRTAVMVALGSRHLLVANELLNMGADFRTVDEEGETLLHIAARIGDLPMVQRLLKAGCEVDAVNRWGETPLHVSMNANSIEIVEELIAGGSKAISQPDLYGNTCYMYAAEQGNLEMLHKLETHGARCGSVNILGCGAAYLAAEMGHWEVLEFLRSRGEDLYAKAIRGTTAVLASSATGHLEATKYLIKGRPSIVNEANEKDQTPILRAAAFVCPLTIEYLLEAGADPYQRSTWGLNAIDYAVRYGPSMREMHKARHFHVKVNQTQQRQILRDIVRKSCESLLVAPTKPSLEELFDYLETLGDMTQILLMLEDWTAAKFCFMERFWPTKVDLLKSSFICDICGSKSPTGDSCVCKSCYVTTYLCKTCHKDYTDAGNQAPEALNEIRRLEELVCPVRVATCKLSSIVSVWQITRYFEAGYRWMLTKLDEYEEWEQKYNSSNKYRELDRPGQEFLKMIQKFHDLLIKDAGDGEVEPETLKRSRKLDSEYKVQRRKHRADREQRVFVCKNHEYLCISKDEHEKEKSAGLNIDSETGKVTSTFLQELLNNYSHGTNDQAKDIDSSGGGLLKRSPISEDVLQHIASRPRGPLRSFTTTHLGPVRTHSSDDLLPSFSPGMPLLAQTRSTESQRSKLRRAQTLPISTSNTKLLQNQTISLEIKPTKLVTAIEARIIAKEDDTTPSSPLPKPSQPIVKKTVSLSMTNEPAIPVESRKDTEGPVAKDDVPRENPALAPDQIAATEPLTSEPESMTEGETVVSIEHHGAAGEGTNASTTDSSEGDSTIDTLSNLYILLHNQNDISREDLETWWAALTVTEEMVPGFMRGYIELKREEREQEG